MLKFKKEVKIGNITPQLIIGIEVVLNVYASYSLDCFVTSACDYRHSAIYSEHYQGHAADIRTKNIPTAAMKEEIFSQILQNLPQGFVLLFEGKGTDVEHFHLSYRPKYDER